MVLLEFIGGEVGGHKRGGATNAELIVASATRSSKRLMEKKDLKCVSASSDTAGNSGGKKKRGSAMQKHSRSRSICQAKSLAAYQSVVLILLSMC